MKKILSLLAVVSALFFTTPAFAQATAVCALSAGVQPSGMLVGGVDSSHCYWLLVNSNGSINTVASGGAPYSSTVVAGTQRSVAMAAATALTIPATATISLISVNGTNNSSGVCAYWQDDDINPTGAAGSPLAAGAYMSYSVSSLPIKLIQATGATCTFNAAYYK